MRIELDVSHAYNRRRLFLLCFTTTRCGLGMGVTSTTALSTAVWTSEWVSLGIELGGGGSAAGCASGTARGVCWHRCGCWGLEHVCYGLLFSVSRVFVALCDFMLFPHVETTNVVLFLARTGGRMLRCVRNSLLVWWFLGSFKEPRRICGRR